MPMGNTRYVSDLSISEKVLMAVVRAAENFRRTHSAIFRQYGLTFQKYNVLRVLDASEKGRNSISSISKIMLVPGANMTGITQRLERGGFITRKADPHDERITMLEITPKGRKILKRITKEKDQTIAVILKGFSNEDKLHLLAEIKHLIRNNRQRI
jgi:DNA-binding MarR family transcriptional regulator